MPGEGVTEVSKPSRKCIATAVVTHESRSERSWHVEPARRHGTGTADAVVRANPRTRPNRAPCGDEVTGSRSSRKPEGQSDENVAPGVGEPRNANKQSTRGVEVIVSRSNRKPEGQSETNVAPEGREIEDAKVIDFDLSQSEA